VVQVSRTPQITFPVALILVATIASLRPSLAFAQVFKVRHNFTGTAGSPYNSTLTQGRDGRLYGSFSNDETTCIGGLFRFGPGGGGGVMYTFPGSGCSDPVYPYGGVTLATDGNYYGTTEFNGAYGAGMLYKINSSGTLIDIHDFYPQTDGNYAVAAPIEGTDGNLYGTTGSAVYKYARDGSFTTIFFVSLTTDPVIQAADGNLYGTTPSGGTGGCGTIFKITTSGMLLHTYSFPCEAGGEYPYAPIMQASDGNFYGTTQSDCGYVCVYYGTVYKMTPEGVVSTIHSFGAQGGNYPQSGLTEGTDGYLYGGTWGNSVLYRISKDGNYEVLYAMTNQSGTAIAAELMQDTNGIFYGTAANGGRYDYGTVFSLDMGLGPFVRFVRPAGKVGQSAQILGQGLTGSTSVMFNGVPALSFSVVSDTYMTAVVPSGATTGPVVVTTPSGTFVSNVSFRVSQ